MTGKTAFVFPTPIYYDARAGNPALNEALTARIREMATKNPSDDAFRAHRGGYYSPGTFLDLDLPEVKDVNAVIQAGVDVYLRDLGIAQSVAEIAYHGWVALTRAGDYQTPHLHGGATISGVYYVSGANRPEPEGCIDFITPIDAQECTFVKGHSRSHCRVIPEAGGLVIFPSYLRHYTHPFQGNSERICVVFNANIRQDRVMAQQAPSVRHQGT